MTELCCTWQQLTPDGDVLLVLLQPVSACHHTKTALQLLLQELMLTPNVVQSGSVGSLHECVISDSFLKPYAANWPATIKRPVHGSPCELHSKGVATSEYNNSRMQEWNDLHIELTWPSGLQSARADPLVLLVPPHQLLYASPAHALHIVSSNNEQPNRTGRCRHALFT